MISYNSILYVLKSASREPLVGRITSTHVHTVKHSLLVKSWRTAIVHSVSLCMTMGEGLRHEYKSDRQTETNVLPSQQS